MGIDSLLFPPLWPFFLVLFPKNIQFKTQSQIAAQKKWGLILRHKKNKSKADKYVLEKIRQSLGHLNPTTLSYEL